jgi:hypothetical protein
MERVVGVSLPAWTVLGGIVAKVNLDVKVPAALPAVDGNLVRRVLVWVYAFLRERTLLFLELHIVAAIPTRDGGGRSSTGVMTRRRGRKQVSAGCALVAWVVCEEVL